MPRRRRDSSTGCEAELRPRRHPLQQRRPERARARRRPSSIAGADLALRHRGVAADDDAGDPPSWRRACGARQGPHRQHVAARRPSTATRGSPTTRRRRWAWSASPARSPASWRRIGVNVNAVCPGAIRTRAHDRLAPEVIERIRASDAHRLHRPSPRTWPASSRSWPATTPATSPASRILIDGGRWMI